MTTHARLELNGPVAAGFDEVITPDALEFVAELQHRFGPRRAELLEARAAAVPGWRRGRCSISCPTRGEVREADWTVAPVPPRTCSSAGSRSPARPTARWPSTR